MLFLVIISSVISFINFQQCLACLPGGGMFNSYSNPYGSPYNNYLYGNGNPNAIAAPNQNQSSKKSPQNAQTAQNAAFANAYYMYPTTGIAGAFDNIGRAIANVGRAKEMACRAILEGK